MARLWNLVRVYTPTLGTADLDIGAAVPPFMDFSGIADGARIPYSILDGLLGSEIGWGIYTMATQKLTRNVRASTNGGGKLNLSGAAQVQISPAAEDLGGLLSNARLAKTAGYTVANNDKGQTIALGGNDFYALTFNAASGYDADFAVLVVNEDTGRAKTISPSGVASFKLYPGQSVKIFNQNNAWQIFGKSRWRIPGNTNFYVRTDGNDSNDGLASNAAGAFLTLNGTFNALVGALDFNANTVIVNVADGTYTGQLAISQAWTGGGNIVFLGNIATPSNCLLNVAADNCIFCNTVLPGTVSIKGFKLTTAAGSGIAHYGLGTIILYNMDFGACWAWQIGANVAGAIINCATNYTISGGATGHFLGNSGGQINFGGLTVTLIGTPAFSAAFAYCTRLGIISSMLIFSGSATGPRYSIDSNGVIYTAGAGANYFPGNSAGSTSSGGQYL